VQNTIHEPYDCQYLFVIWASSHPLMEPGYPLSRYPLQGHLVYRHYLTGDERLPVSELYSLTPAKSAD